MSNWSQATKKWVQHRQMVGNGRQDEHLFWWQTTQENTKSLSCASGPSPHQLSSSVVVLASSNVWDWLATHNLLICFCLVIFQELSSTQQLTQYCHLSVLSCFSVALEINDGYWVLHKENNVEGGIRLLKSCGLYIKSTWTFEMLRWNMTLLGWVKAGNWCEILQITVIP